MDLDLGPLDDDAVCSKPPKLGELCVDGLRTAIERGLGDLLDGYFDDDGPSYRARFRFDAFSHEQTDEGIAVSFSWNFRLVDPDGEPVVMLSETTTGPDFILPEASPDGAVGAALSAVLDHIADVLNDSDLIAAGGDE